MVGAVAHRRAGLWWVIASAALAGCGPELPDDLGTATGGIAVDAQGAADDTASEQATELLREVFTYRGSGRDPFQSLLTPGGQVRPFLEDLRVTSIYMDPRYPARSVAVLRDTTVNRRYDVRVDDQVGRMRVTEIRQYEVVFTIEDFGVPRQVTVSLRQARRRTP